ncbi:endonuclease MutS2 [Leptolyngbya sp. FACHB-321]|uniref:endonuclease MutS2 n=1 Tax=Leptolyngbya sp. FACHB-321 TaxID=2692807 RepID=UPI0016842FBA|nr:endonuclease MutS2 [Leptolyngbya sp. FACHB-321]MBD2034237.1 endonuclease MutS2 [Leptolyngbya sp. FACHB-321]
MIQAETLELLEWSRLCQHLSTFAATKLGAIAARRLRIPDTQAETLTLLAQTQDVYALESRLSTGLKFDGITDIGESLERAERRALLSGEELLAIATTLAGMRTLRRVIDNQPDLLVLNALIQDLRTYPELEQEIHRCIDDRGQVADRATPKLAGIREQQKQLRDRVYSTLQSILQRKANAVQESLITQREGRFVIPVKAPQKDAIPGIVHDTSMSGATLYVEPQATVNLNNQLRQLQRQEQVEEEAVRQALTDQVAVVKPDLERLLAIATTLDLATARARYSLWLEANPPRFVTRERKNASAAPPESIVLRNLRHPLLIWQQQHEQGRPVVPIDLVIQPHIRVVAITGPNTGGKTVTLKTLGLAVLMAKVGLYVPAREPVELPWFDQVLADIGDEQSLEQSLSTFSGHIRRISRILAALGERDEEAGGERQEAEGEAEEAESRRQEAGREIQISNLVAVSPSASPFPAPRSPLPTPYSLVLLDEVGAGTDPSEGSALAIALLNHLADHAGLTIATTHFGELKALKYQDDRFENASVEFDDVLLSPTYRLLWGIPGRSNALTIARRLGLDASVVEQAQALVGGASEDVNQVIAGLEAQRRRQETKSQEAAQLLESAEHLHRELSRKAASLKEREQSLQQAQEQAVQAAIAQAKSEIAQVIRQLQQGPVSAQAAQQATDSLHQLAERRLPSRQPKPPKPGFRPQVGDRVRIPRLGQTAEVLTAPNDDEEITVRFGLMKMTVPIDDVESLDGEKAVKKPKAETRSQEPEARSQKPGATQSPPTHDTPTPNHDTPIIRTARNTIDIRGSRVADAEPMMEQAIAQAYESGVLWIIHGHGTGKLRQGVHAFLQQHPQVERYELASRADGGAGVTLAYLR